jgi:hypothetical protein
VILRSRRATRWLLTSLLLLALLVASYVRYAGSVPLVHGGTFWGVTYGVLATLLVLLLTAFGLRKRAYRSTWGTLDGWLQAHIYLGLLSVVVVALHAGFRFRDQVATAAAVALVAVVATGFVGARLYAALPRRLTRVESNLTVEEISVELNRLTQAMERLSASRSPLFARIARDLLKAARPRRLAGWRLLLAAGGGEPEPERDRETLLRQLPEDEREPMRQVLVLYRQHRELHLRLRYQQRYKNLLEAWLYLHVPLTVVLIVLIAVHVAAVFYFGAV